MPENVQPLINIGIAGCVLAWFMFRTEPRLKGIEDAINRFSKTILLLILKMNDLGALEKDEINKMIDEIKLTEGQK